MREVVAESAQKIKKHARRGVGLVLLGGALAGCSSVSAPDADTQATAKYDRAFTAASPAGKFALQYLVTTDVALHKDNGSFFPGDGKSWIVHINNACLGGSAFNIAGGSISASVSVGDILSVASASVDAKIPAAAAYLALDMTNPDDVTVHSGNVDGPDLHFSGANDGSTSLEPLDDQTKNILKSYGCAQGVVGREVVFSNDAVSSSYIN